MNRISAREVFKVGMYLAGIVVTVYAFTAYVEYLVDKRLESPQTIDRFARKIRPSIIFDNDGAILADLGALDYVDADIGIKYYEETPRLPAEIKVKCNTVLSG